MITSLSTDPTKGMLVTAFKIMHVSIKNTDIPTIVEKTTLNICFIIFLLYKKINRRKEQAVGEFTNQSINDSIGLSGKPYCITNSSPTCNRPGINNDTNTRKHRFNDVLYSHRMLRACDSPEPYGPP